MKKTTRRSVLKGFAAGASLVLVGCGSSTQNFVSTGTAGATVLPEEIVFQFEPDTWPEGTTQLEFRFLGPPQDSQGQGLVEYALILVLVSITVIVILQILGPQIERVFEDVVVEITGRTDSGEPTAMASVAISTLSVETGSSFAPIVTAQDTSPVELFGLAVGPNPILLDAASPEGVQTTLELSFSNQDRIEAAPSEGTYTNNNPDVFNVDEQGVVTVADPLSAFEGTLGASVSRDGAVAENTIPVRVGRLEVASHPFDFMAGGSSAPVSSILFTDGNGSPEEVVASQSLEYRIEPPVAGMSIGSDGSVSAILTLDSQLFDVVVTYNNGERDYTATYTMVVCDQFGGCVA